MLAVIQRVRQASVSIEGHLYSEIGQGLLVLLGVGQEDREEDVNWLTSKIASLRIFSDTEGKMNLSLKDIGGQALVVSQFTLFANTKNGNRPSFIDAARPELAIPLYESFVSKLQSDLGSEVKTGKFAADMQVNLLNDGPVTILIDTKNKK